MWNRVDIALVGLGNPGVDYEGTRHNIGFVVVDEIARRYATSVRQRKHRALIGRAHFGPLAAILVKPLTYMNRSGDAVRAIADAYELSPDRVWVIVDDFQIPFGTLRVRRDGRDGGHGGLKSIIARLGTEDFPRVRLGIGKPENLSSHVGYVLSPFRPDERETAQRLVERAADAVEVACREGIEIAMSRFNGSVV